MNEAQENWVTVMEAAAIRGVSNKAIYELIKKGRLDVMEQSGQKFIKQAQIENYKQGKRGRPPKREFQQFLSASERVEQKIKNPENFYKSFFIIYLRFRKLWKVIGKDNSEQIIQEIIDRFSHKTLRKNKIDFRRKFKCYERSIQTKVLWNEQITVERVYSNSRVQMFFEYVLYSEEIRNTDFNLDTIYVRFINEFTNEFKWLWDEIITKHNFEKEMEMEQSAKFSPESIIAEIEKHPAIVEGIQRRGRSHSYIDEKGKIRNLKKNISQAIYLWNDGKSGKEILEKLLPVEKYNGKPNHKNRHKDFRNLKSNLRYHSKKHPEFFSHPFDASLFGRNVWSPKISEN